MRRHELDWSVLPSGLLFVALGVLALVIGNDRFSDALPAVWSTTLIVLGGGLLARSAAGQHRSRDEIGAEGREDREVEQAGGGHDR